MKENIMLMCKYFSHKQTTLGKLYCLQLVHYIRNVKSLNVYTKKLQTNDLSAKTTRLIPTLVLGSIKMSFTSIFFAGGEGITSGTILLDSNACATSDMITVKLVKTAQHYCEFLNLVLKKIIKKNNCLYPYKTLDLYSTKLNINNKNNKFDKNIMF